MPQQKREIESYIHDDTLKLLIVANWLNVNGVVRYTEEVTHLVLSAPNKDGVRTIRFTIEPNIQII